MSSGRKKARPFSSRTAPDPCSACGAKTDRASSITGTPDTPQPGHVTVCRHCGNLAILTEDLRRRTMTVAEVNALPEDFREFLATAEEARRLVENDSAIRRAFRRARAGG